MTQTLPREVTWHPELQQLVFSPVEEQAQLRRGLIGSLKEQRLPAGSEVPLGLPPQVGNQSEVMVSFEKPAVATRFAVRVMTGEANKGGTQFFVDYVPPVDGETVTKVSVGAVGGTTDTLKLLASDKTIDMRLFVDNTFTEVYWMDGRVAMTTTTAATQAAEITISADKAGTTLASVQAWKIGSIWVSPEEVLQTPRLDAAVTI